MSEKRAKRNRKSVTEIAQTLPETSTQVILEDVHIGVSVQTKNIYVGTLRDVDTWDKKVLRNGDFYSALLELCPPGQTITFSGAGRTFAITLAEVTKLIQDAPHPGLVGPDSKKLN